MPHGAPNGSSLHASSAAVPTLLLVAGALFLSLLVGCSGESARHAPLHDPSRGAFQQEPFRTAAGTRKRALQALDSLRQDALRGAFEALDTLGHTRHVRTEQMNADGTVEAFEERVLCHTAAGRLRVLRSDSSGTFDFGALQRFTDTQAGAPTTDLMQQVLPEKPAFLSQRNRYAFQYRLLADTTLESGPAHVVAVRARPDAGGDKQTVRRARLYLDADSHQLMALQLYRKRNSLLFDEATHLYVRVRPAPNRTEAAAWIPAETRFETRFDMPLRPARHFRSTTSYDFSRPAPS